MNARPRETPSPNSEPESLPEGFVFRTELARSLWAIRQRIVASGERMLSWRELEAEQHARRGGVQDSGSEAC